MVTSDFETSANDENEGTNDCEKGLEAYSSMSVKYGHLTKALIYIVALSEGLTHLASLATSYLFKDEMHLSPAQFTAINALPYSPYIIRPLLAYATDSIPIFGTRRKHYLIIFSLIQSFSYLSLALVKASVIGISVILFAIQLSTAFCMTIAEALMVEYIGDDSSKQLKASDAVSFFVGCRTAASLAVAYFSGSLLEHYSKRHIFMATSCFPLMITACAVRFKEPQSTSSTRAVNPIPELITFLRHPIVMYPALYVYAFVAGPGYFDCLFYYITNALDYSSTFVGTMKLVGGMATIFGVVIYKWLLKGIAIRKILFWSTLMFVPLYMSPALTTSGLSRKLHIPDKPLLLTGDFLMDAAYELMMLPILSYISKVPPIGLEASVFTAVLTVKAVGVVTSKLLNVMFTYALGITATDFTNMTWFIIICGVGVLAPLFVIKMVPTEDEMDLFLKKYAMTKETELQCL